LDSNTGVLTKILRLRLLDGDHDETDHDRPLQGLSDRLDGLDCSRRVAEEPRIDWSQPPEQVITVRRAMWESVQLDEQTWPSRAEWLVPERPA
jgi:hypothetical protein